MRICTLVTTKTAALKVMESTTGQLLQYSWASLLADFVTVKVFGITKKGICTRDTTKMIKNLVKDCTDGTTVQSTKDISRTTIGTATERCFGLMVESIKVCGPTVLKMQKSYRYEGSQVLPIPVTSEQRAKIQKRTRNYRI